MTKVPLMMSMSNAKAARTPCFAGSLVAAKRYADQREVRQRGAGGEQNAFAGVDDEEERAAPKASVALRASSTRDDSQ
jgi:hypothetical protein